LSKIAPSDTLKIWKVGQNIRMDFNLVGFQNLKNKKRKMTILFKNNEIILINNDKKTLVNPLEDLDEEEKIAILSDILRSDPIQNSLNITEQKWEE
jgi:hypothetical protein